MHVARIAAPPLLAVHPGDHLEAIGILELVGGDEARAHGVRVVEVLALAGPELAGHLLRLLVARREVVEDGVAEDVLARARLRDVLAGPPDVAAELELEVELLAVRRPGHLGAGAAHREAARMVEDRPLVPGLRGILPNRLERLHQVLFETQKIPHLRRMGDRREQRDVGERQHVGGVLERFVGAVQGVLAALDDLEHAGEAGQHRDLAPAVHQRAGHRCPPFPGGGESKRDESHAVPD